MKKSTYFNNSKTQYKKKTGYDVNFNLESDTGAREAVQKTWNELRKNLESMEFDFGDNEEIKKIPFIGILHKILEYEYVKKLMTVELKYYAKSKKFVRAAKVNPEEKITTDRFIPKANFMQSSNRFSPKGVEWLYLGFDRYIKDAKKCCYAEIRAKEEDNVKFCEFEYSNEAHKVIDLTKSINRDLEDICHREGKTPEEITETFIFEFYCKILAEEIFLPINSSDKDREYAPFHCMAKYFQSLGFDGIIYKSTVSQVGKNIVMFDKESFYPIDGSWEKQK